MPEDLPLRYQARHLEFQGWSTCSNHTAHGNLRPFPTLIFPTAEQFFFKVNRIPSSCSIVMLHQSAKLLLYWWFSLSKGTIFQKIFRTSWASSLISLTFPFSIKPSHTQSSPITTLLPPSYSKQNDYQCFFLYLNKANKDDTFPSMDSQG